MPDVAALHHDVILLIVNHSTRYSITCCHGVDNIRIRSICIKVSRLFDVMHDVFYSGSL